jgi:phage replication initiation protein
MELSSKPPYSNTGVVNTRGFGLIALVDWVEATFPHETNVEKIIKLLGFEIDDFYELADGNNGYKSKRIMGNISISYDPSEKYSAQRQSEMGIHISITGQGCREYELLQSKSWSQLFRDIKDLNGHFSRLDVAIDDIRYGDDKPFFKVNYLLSRAKKGYCRSKFKGAREFNKFKIKNGMSEGRTMYIGSSKSSLMFRIYEKDFERLAEGKELEAALTAWNRFELQMRDERADSMALYIIDNNDLGQQILGVINQYVSFVDPDPNDSNKSRWKISKFWERFLNGVGKLPLTEVAPDRTIETRKRWIDKATPRTLAMLFHAGELDQKELETKIVEGTELMSKKDFNEVDLHLKNKQKQTEFYTNIRYDVLLKMRNDLMRPQMSEKDYETYQHISKRINDIEKHKKNQPIERID